jgi:flagellar basal-body rod protein FlgF
MIYRSLYMDSASYIAAAGMKANLRALDIVSNNLANVNSPGFKQDSPFYRELQLAHGDLRGSAVAGTTTEFSAGTLRSTGNPLDLAINNPNGFFKIETQAGQGYTRNGSFSINEVDELVTQNGNRVLNDRDLPVLIQLDPNSNQEMVISPNGEISQGEVILGKISAVDFEDLSALKKLESQIFITDQQPVEMATPNIQQGVLEESNASAVSSMLDMVELQRMYDMNSKVISSVMGGINKAAIQAIAS